MAAGGQDDGLRFIEAAEGERAPGRGLLLLLFALLIAALVGGGWYMVRERSQVAIGDGSLIKAPPGPYKVKPDEVGGMAVEGRGDAAFAASEGLEAQGQLDLSKAPEAPVELTRTSPADPAPARSEAAVRTSNAPLPTAVQGAPLPAGGGTVQLGSFNSEAQAQAAWASLSKRFGYLSALPHTVATGEVNGRAVYRLRAGAGGEARTVCAKLRVAGENCLVVD